MCEYEYFILDIDDEDELSVEQVLEQIEDEGEWRYFGKCQFSNLEFVAEEILKEKYADWDMFEEDDAVVIAVKEIGEDKEIEVYQVSIKYVLSVATEMIFDNDDLRQEKQEETM
ncbi:hypothetical protein ACWIUA_11105 [Ursidibacter sp. B-7004-1]